MGVTPDIDIENENGVGTPGIPVFPGSLYRTVFSRSNIGLSNSGTGTQIYQFTGKGRLEHFVMELEDKNTDIFLFIDSVQVMGIDCRVWNDMNYKFEKHGDLPFYYNKVDKIFKFYPNYPVNFETSFEIKARASNEDVRSYVVSYTDET